MDKKYIIISAIVGGLGVAIGAFGAHGLKSIISHELLETYKTGVLYHLVHSVVLLAISFNTVYRLKLSYIFILLGILLFSFSLYAYTITELKFFVIVTPFGGLSLIIGWLSIIYNILRKT